MHLNIKKGIYIAFLAATISGFSVFYNKLILIKGVDSLIFNIIKNGGVALLLSVFLLLRQRAFVVTSIKSNWKKLLVLGAIGGSIPFFLFFEGLSKTTAINAQLIQKTLFVWVALLAIPALGERLTKIQIAGYLLILYANLFIGGFNGFTGNTGELMIFSATLFWSLEAIIIRRFISSGNATILAWGRMFFGSLLLLCFAIFQHKIHLFTALSPMQILPIAGSIAFLSGYTLFWYHALRFAPATTVTSILVMATPITNILTALFITHSLAQDIFLNIFLTAFGIILITLISKRNKSVVVNPT